MYKGIDVSDNQGVIDWKKVKKAGVEFAILRTVRRSNKPDNCLLENIKGCLENSIPFDFYKYSYAVTEAEAIAEVKRVVEVLESYGIKPSTDFVIWMDVEDDVQMALSTEKLTAIVQAFKKAVLDAGFEFGLYMGKYDFEKGEVAFPLLGETHAWIARYYDGYEEKPFAEYPDEKYKPTVENGKLWGWQYTSSGKVDGINGDVDLDIAYYEIIPKNNTQGESTVKKYASKVIEQAVSWLGKKESNGSHKEIIDVYNSHKPLARGYAVKYTDSWCATFVSAVAIKLGYTDIIPTECSCQKMIDLFKKIGCWVENENRTPEPGEVIFYDWQDSGSGDNTGWSDHVGIVESVSGGKITVIEGNYDNAVKKRSLAVNGRYIRGYGVPCYDKEPAESKPTTTTSNEHITAIAKEVIAGQWGNGHENRKEKIYEAVRKEVNRLLK